MRSSLWLSRLISGVGLFTLAGCIPIATQWKLRHFNPATADIAQLRVAVRPPAWATATPERTVLAAKYEFADGGPGRTLDIHLRRGAHPEDRVALERLTPAAESLVVYEAAAADLVAIRAFQAEIGKADQGGRHGRGEATVVGSLACRTADIPEGPILVDAYIHASDELGWLPLAEAADLKAYMPANENVEERAPFCEKPAGRAAR
jgi:hypothetical protein